MDNFTPDGITDLVSGRPDDVEVVTFRGFLSAEKDGGIYRLYTSRSLDEWLEIPKPALLYQLPGRGQRDGFSIVWVKRHERLISCRRAKACHLVVEADSEFEMDPTSAGAKYPKYP